MRTTRWERTAGRAGDPCDGDRSSPCRSALPYGDPEDYPDDEDEDDDRDEDEEDEDEEEEEEEPEWYVRPDACGGHAAARETGARLDETGA